MLWSVPGDAQLYQQNNNNWSYYFQGRRYYYLNEATDTCLLDLVLPISVRTLSNSFKIEGLATNFILLPPVKNLSNFEDETAWSTLSEGFYNTINDPTILLNEFIIPADLCNNLVEGIIIGIASIVSDGSFNVTSPI